MPRLRRFVVADVPEAADAAEKAYRNLQGAQARPTTARIASAVAPDGPGPPPAGGRRNPVAVA